MTIRVEVLSLGFNNLNSVVSALNSLDNVDVRVVESAEESRNAHLAILPGTGTFSYGVLALRGRGFWDLLLDRHENHQPILGICLGMQLLGDSSEESPGYDGLGIISGASSELSGMAVVPNVGWEEVRWQESKSDSLLHLQDSSFYFMHGYEILPSAPDQVLGIAESRNKPYVAAVRQGRTIGVQFHPEKSSKAGIEFLSSVSGWARG